MSRYTYRFYRFASHSDYAARWAEAGLPLGEDGAPAPPPGAALDEVGVVTRPGATEEDPPIAVDGWHVNVAWAGAPPGALEAHAIDPFEGLRVFAGWSDPQPPPPVPETIDNVQARVLLMRLGLFDQVDAALRAEGGAAWQFWEYANKIQRHNSPLVAAMAARLGLTEAQLDDLFRQAAAIVG